MSSNYEQRTVTIYDYPVNNLFEALTQLQKTKKIMILVYRNVTFIFILKLFSINTSNINTTYIDSKSHCQIKY